MLLDDPICTSLKHLAGLHVGFHYLSPLILPEWVVTLQILLLLFLFMMWYDVTIVTSVFFALMKCTACVSILEEGFSSIFLRFFSFFLLNIFLFGPRSMDRESYLLCWFQGPFSPICDLIDLKLTSWTSTISHTDWLKQAEPVTSRCKLYKVWWHHVFIYSNNKL